jgi:hypothetical protein
MVRRAELRRRMVVADPAVVMGFEGCSSGDGRSWSWPRPGLVGEVGRLFAGRRGVGDRPAMFDVPVLCGFASLVYVPRARLD